jgi:hypothetical protein
MLGTNPFQARQVVEGGFRDGRGRDVEALYGLGDGEGGGLEPVGGVGGIAGSDLGLHQGAQQLVGRPALGFGGQQHFGGGAAHRGQLQPPQATVQVQRQRWNLRGRHRFGGFRRGHELAPSSVVDEVGSVDNCAFKRHECSLGGNVLSVTVDTLRV